MSSDSIGLPRGAGSGFRVPWVSSIALSRFVLAVHLGVGVGSGPLLECCRAALAVWIRKLNISACGSEGGAPASSADKAMLDWLVLSGRSGWTPKEVLVWFFPFF
jgi:hypothetical protein